MSASAWVTDLRAAIRAYEDSRRTTPVVRLTLTSGAKHFVYRMSAHPGDQLVALDVYPSPDPRAFVEVERPAGPSTRMETTHETPEVLLVDPLRILMVELLHQRPREARGDVGFDTRSPES
jgi:hypothetical protein